MKNDKLFANTSWNLEDGYISKDPEAFPYRASGGGKNGGLKFHILQKTPRDKKLFKKGYKMSLHLPCEVPRIDRNYYRIPFDKSVTLIVSPSMMITESLKNYDVQTRQCHFQSEQILKRFNMYTRSNCELECLADFIQKSCNCTPYYIPQLVNEDSCKGEQLKCIETANRNLTKHNMETSLKTSKGYDDRGSIACGCLPPCTNLQYDGEVSYAELGTASNDSE